MTHIDESDDMHRTQIRETASTARYLRILQGELVQAINLAIQNELTCAVESGTSEKNTHTQLSEMPNKNVFFFA